MELFSPRRGVQLWKAPAGASGAASTAAVHRNDTRRARCEQRVMSQTAVFRNRNETVNYHHQSLHNRCPHRSEALIKCQWLAPLTTARTPTKGPQACQVAGRSKTAAGSQHWGTEIARQNHSCGGGGAWTRGALAGLVRNHPALWHKRSSSRLHLGSSKNTGRTAVWNFQQPSPASALICALKTQADCQYGRYARRRSRVA